METEEVTKIVDGIYKRNAIALLAAMDKIELRNCNQDTESWGYPFKDELRNILDKFNPGARQLISAGKAYLKALHGAAAASRVYVDAVGRLGKHAQQGTWGGSTDIGTALMQIVNVYKEIQEQQMNILKAFYVDLLVPLETNLEKDTKVVQSEQKRFLQQHKLRAESYSKAAAAIKKQRKKRQTSAMDKELKNMQLLEEEKTKLDAFCEQSLKNAMTQERRRYGFVLERQCSLAKHWLAYHLHATTAHTTDLEEWLNVASTREYLPNGLETVLTAGKMRVTWPDEEGSESSLSALRKARSVDVSCLDIRSIDAPTSPPPSLPRAKSELQLSHSVDEDHSPTHGHHGYHRSNVRPQSMALPPTGLSTLTNSTSGTGGLWNDMISLPLCRALYAYLSSGDNQLSFLEGDMIAPLGERNKGWQFGENLRTQCSGWFPLAYTEIVDDTGSPTRYGTKHSNAGGMGSPGGHSSGGMSRDSPPLSEAPTPTPPIVNSHQQQQDRSPQRMFGDTLLMHRNSKLFRRVTGHSATNSHPGPPPAAPAPVPTPTVPNMPKPLPQSHSTNFNTHIGQNSQQNKMKQSKSHYGFPTGQNSVQTLPLRERVINKTKTAQMRGSVPVGNVSLHSSNDSGFSNEPPPQPEVDYSDDENAPHRVPIRHRKLSKPLQRSDTDSRIRQSHSFGNLTEQMNMQNEQFNQQRAMIKRTKSFWKFGRSDQILEGMSLWKHRDLVDVTSTETITKPMEIIEIETKNNNTEIAPNLNTENKSQVIEYRNSKQSFSSVNSQPHEFSKSEIDNRIQKHNDLISNSNTITNSVENLNDNVGNNNIRASKRSEKMEIKTSNSDLDNQFYDDNDDGLLLKTVRRKEILQQYNSSSTDAESVSSSDPYDCIVVQDHLASRDGKKIKYHENMKDNMKTDKKPVQMTFKTFRGEDNEQENEKIIQEPELIQRPSLLPRTKLAKSSSVGPTMKTVMKFEQEIGLMSYGSTLRDRMKVANVNPNTGNTYGPWYDLWAKDASVTK